MPAQPISVKKYCDNCWYLGHVDDHCGKCFKRKDKLCNPICRNQNANFFDSRIKDPRAMVCDKHSYQKGQDPYVIHGVEWYEEQNLKTSSIQKSK